MVAIISISACSAEQDPNVLKVIKSSDEIVGELSNSHIGIRRYRIYQY